MEIKDAYTFRETIAILGIGHAALERWTRNRSIKSFKKCGHRLYPISEIKRILGWRKCDEIIRDTPEVGV
ncbi:MAG: hypothetical protein WC551_09230 [Patescibacteria group bacterium]